MTLVSITRRVLSLAGRGARGARGNSVLNGSGSPSNSVGSDGDFYIDTVPDILYGPKAAGAWPGTGTYLRGNTLLSGSGAPSAGLGRDNDYYLDLAAYDLYGPKTAGAWGSPASLTGQATAAQTAANAAANSASSAATSATSAANSLSTLLNSIVPVISFAAIATTPIPAAATMLIAGGYATNGDEGVGTFYQYDAAVDAAYVTAYPLTSKIGTDGRGWRLAYDAQQLALEMAGAKADGVNGTTGTDAYPALCELEALGHQVINTSHVVCAPIYLRGNYRVSQTYVPHKIVNIIGVNAGHDGSPCNQLFFPQNISGIIIGNALCDGYSNKLSFPAWTANTAYTAGSSYVSTASGRTYKCTQSGTSAASGSGPTTYGQNIPDGTAKWVFCGAAEGSILRGFSLMSDGGTATDAHAVWLRGRANLENLYYNGFPGNSENIVASTGATGPTYGNCNNWKSLFCHSHSSGGHAHYNNLSDANAGTSLGFETKTAGGCAILNVGTLGCFYQIGDLTGYGNKGIYDNGRLFRLIVPTTSGTTAPASDPSTWEDVGAGSASSQFPQWVSGQTYTPTLPVLTNGNSNRCIIDLTYVEGSCPSHIPTPSVARVGQANVTRDSNAMGGNLGGGIVTQAGIGSNKTVAAGSPLAALFGTSQSTIIGHSPSSLLPPNLFTHLQQITNAQLYLGYQADDHLDINLHYQNQKSFFSLTGPLTSKLMGRLVPQLYYLTIPDFALQDPTNSNNIRILGIRAAAPTSGYFAQGDFFHNVASTAGGIGGWRCTTTGIITSTAWAGNTAYAKGALVLNAGNCYVCVTAGTSAASGGPTTQTSNITDGTAVWSYQPPFVFTPMQVGVLSSIASAPLGVGFVAVVGTKVYIATGTSSTADWTRVKTQRTISYADGTSITLNGDTTDEATHVNTQAAGTLTFNAPTGSPADGHMITVQLKCTNAQTLSFNAAFLGSTDLPLPSATTGSSKTDLLAFKWSVGANKWLLAAKNFGF